MQPEPVIATAVAHFQRSWEAEQAYLSQANHARALRVVAEQAGNPDLGQIKAAENRASQVWWDQHKITKQAARDLCAALGINPVHLKSAL